MRTLRLSLPAVFLLLMAPWVRAAGARRPRQLKIAIMDLKAAGTDKDVAYNIGNIVVGRVRSFEIGSVISGDDIRAMLAYSKTQFQLGCNEVACVAAIGGALGVDMLLTGSLGRLGRTYILSLQLVDTDHARVISGVLKRFSGTLDEFIPVVEQAVDQLFSKVVRIKPPPLSARVSSSRYWVGLLAPSVSQSSKYGVMALQGEAADFQIGLTGKGKPTSLIMDLSVAQDAVGSSGGFSLNLMTPMLAGLGVRHGFSWAYWSFAVDGGYMTGTAKNQNGGSASMKATVVAPSMDLDFRLGRSFTMGLGGRYKQLFFKDGSTGLAEGILRWGWAF